MFPLRRLKREQPRTNLIIYIDNSHLWIHGQETCGLTWDPALRFEIGRLKKAILQHSGLLPEEGYNVTTKVYGSSPPPVDAFMAGIKSRGEGQVCSLAKNLWSACKGDVDKRMVADALHDASEACEREVPSEFIIVSGNRDLYRAVEGIAKRGFQVHVWSWKTALSSVFEKMQENELVKFHELDDYQEEIISHETKFSMDANALDSGSLVVLNPLAKDDAVNGLIAALNIPIYTYETLRGTNTDVIIVPSERMDTADDAKLIAELQEFIERRDLVITGYTAYVEAYLKASRIEVQVSKRFAEFYRLEEGIALYKTGSEGEKGGEESRRGFMWSGRSMAREGRELERIEEEGESDKAE